MRSGVIDIKGCKLSLQPFSGQLATFLGKDRDYLRNKHLIPMVRDGALRFRYPESAKHPHQAYVAGRREDNNNG